MKKLTDEWKVKKFKSHTKSFHESIDFSIPDTKKHGYNVSTATKVTPKRKTAEKTAKLDEPVCFQNDSSFPKRRSGRLREKTMLQNMQLQTAKMSPVEQSRIFSNSFNDNMMKDIASLESKLLTPTKRKDVSGQVKVSNFTDKAKNKPHFSEILNEKLHMRNDGEVDAATFSDVEVSSVSDYVASSSSVSTSDKENCRDLSNWGLPTAIVFAYRAKNINIMFPWQVECLSMKNVLDGGNLVYSAPTSAGKTLVAEILMLKKVVETRKKALMILPFVSVVREKVNYFQEMFQDAGIVVGGYMGAHRPAGGFKAIDIAICTIEKANNLINRLMEENRLDELGILVIDELHMLGDYSRGYLLELLLTKLLYNSKKNNINIQIVGMSATLPNLNVLAFWLNAELYRTDFRPVPLKEMYKIGNIIFDAKTAQQSRDLKNLELSFPNDSDHTIYLTMETIAAGHGILIFCPSKNWCEKLATNIAREIYNAGKPLEKQHGNSSLNNLGEKLREHINGRAVNSILQQLKESPAGLDSVLGLTVPFGVAFHHAGLTFDERDIVEGAFKQGILKVLVATTTLSSGVNLPARRVLIRSPLFCGSVIDILSYKQMVGRAGRKGIDNAGESILICKDSERSAAMSLVRAELPPVKSCLIRSGKSGLHSSLKRAIIEVIASGVVCSHEEVTQYAGCTLLFASMIHESNSKDLSNDDVEASINKCLNYLLDNEFFFKQEKNEDDIIQISYKPSQLGLAVLASGFSPEDALRVLRELQLARRCFVLENDLHILYEVTPPYLSEQMGSINWMRFLSIWEELSDEYKRVAELIGVQESFIGLGVQGRLNRNDHKTAHKLAIHQRFFATLALNDLIQETPLAVVSEKYSCTKGILQSLQQTTSTFAGMLTIFCNRLGWHNLELLFTNFQKRVHFGVQQELCELVQLSTLNAQRARFLYNAGFETIASLASAEPEDLSLLLCNAGSFESAKQLDGDMAEEALRRREVKRIRITGKQGVDEEEASKLIIKEAQMFIKQELGIKTISWHAEKFSEPQPAERSNDKILEHQNDSVDLSNSDMLENKSKIEASCVSLSTELLDKKENLKKDLKLSSNKNDLLSNSKTIHKETGGESSQNSHACNVSGAISFSESVLSDFIVDNSPVLNSTFSKRKSIVNTKQEEVISIEDYKCSVLQTSIRSAIRNKKNRSALDSSSCLQNVDANHQADRNCNRSESNVPLNIPEIELLFESFENSMTSFSSNDRAQNAQVLDDDKSFNEILLSQTAETGNIYLSESFMELNESLNGLPSVHLEKSLREMQFSSNLQTSAQIEGNAHSVAIDNKSSEKDCFLSDSQIDFICDKAIFASQESSNCLDTEEIVKFPKSLKITEKQRYIEDYLTEKDTKVKIQSTPRRSLNSEVIISDDNIINELYSPIDTDFDQKDVKQAVEVFTDEKHSLSSEILNVEKDLETSGDLFELNEELVLKNVNHIKNKHNTSVTNCETVDSLFHNHEIKYHKASDFVEEQDYTHNQKQIQKPNKIKNAVVRNESGMFIPTLENELEIKKNLINEIKDSQCINKNATQRTEDKNSSLSLDSFEELMVKNSSDIFNPKVTKNEIGSLNKIFNGNTASFIEDSSKIFESWENTLTRIVEKKCLNLNYCKEDNSHGISAKENVMHSKYKDPQKVFQSIPEKGMPTQSKQIDNRGKINEVDSNTEDVEKLHLESNSSFFEPWEESQNIVTPTPAVEQVKLVNGSCKESCHLIDDFVNDSKLFQTWEISPGNITTAAIEDKDQEMLRNANGNNGKCSVQMHSKLSESHKNSQNNTFPVNSNSISNDSLTEKQFETNNVDLALNENVFASPKTDLTSFSSDCLSPTPPKTMSTISNERTEANQTGNSPCTNKLKNVRKSEPGSAYQTPKSLRTNISRKVLKSVEKISPMKTPKASEVLNLKIVELSSNEMKTFMKQLAKVPVFAFSVACEKAFCEKTVSIGPPKTKEKATNASVNDCIVNSDIRLTGLSFCWSDTAFFIRFYDSDPSVQKSSESTKNIKYFQDYFQILSSSKTITAYDLKTQYKVLWQGCKIALPQSKRITYMDPSIAAWLLDSEQGQPSLQLLVSKFFPDAVNCLQDFDNRNGSIGYHYWSSVPGIKRAAVESYIAFHLMNALLKELRSKNLHSTFADVEMPAILSVAKMEQNGLGFNLKLAMSYRRELQKKQQELFKKSQQLAGRNFNIKSSREISRILFKELKLNSSQLLNSPLANRHLSIGAVTRSGGRRLPPDLRTNKECLEKVMHLHPLPKAILDWRKMSFATSKVLMPLLRENKFNSFLNMDRLYSTCYVYTVTGRINMHTPNLQFIPRDFNVDVQTDSKNEKEEDGCYTEDDILQYGVSLRKMFIPSTGSLLLSADYSQLELRILAHLSGDAILIKSLNSGNDIFTQIASTWKKMPIACVTDEIRQQAKKICYGIIYGMGAKALSCQLNTTEDEAEFFMKTFKASYPALSEYLKSVVESCQALGCVYTINKRRRQIPLINSEFLGEKAQAERQAVNTTIQGSAADIIKAAMVRIEEELTTAFPDTSGPCFSSAKNDKENNFRQSPFRGGFLVLHLHDELIFEVNQSDLNQVMKIVRNAMENTWQLSVKLPVKVKVGTSWGSMEDIT